jgi:hypothetical protein
MCALPDVLQNIVLKYSPEPTGKELWEDLLNDFCKFKGYPSLDSDYWEQLQDFSIHVDDIFFVYEYVDIYSKKYANTHYMKECASYYIHLAVSTYHHRNTVMYLPDCKEFVDSLLYGSIVPSDYVFTNETIDEDGDAEMRYLPEFD